VAPLRATSVTKRDLADIRPWLVIPATGSWCGCQSVSGRFHNNVSTSSSIADSGRLTEGPEVHVAAPLARDALRPRDGPSALSAVSLTTVSSRWTGVAVTGMPAWFEGYPRGPLFM
jgi:hypothetical protein